MKKPILASIFCLAFTFALRAQQNAPVAPKLTNPFLSPPYSVGVWHVLKGKQDPLFERPANKYFGVPPAKNYFGAGAFAQPLKLAGKFPAAADTGVCSVPLLEAHADAADPGIAIALQDRSVPIPQAHVPAPSCKK